MRLSSLALPVLCVLALHHPQASAQALPLSDSLVVGFWDFNTEEISPNDTSEGQIRLAGFFTKEHAFETVVWSRLEGYQDAATMQVGTLYTGIRLTGTWFIRDTLLGMVTETCVGFTDPGRRECAIDTDELGDTDYVVLEIVDLTGFGRSRVMRSATGGMWGLPIWRHEGTVRDMSDPGFWEGATLALRPHRRGPGSGSGMPAFDVLGRTPSGGATPVRLYPGPSRPASGRR